MVEYVIVNGEKVPKIKCDSVTTLKNKKTGKIYQSEEEIKKEGVDSKDIQRDVKIIIPEGFDVFGKEPLKWKTPKYELEKNQKDLVEDYTQMRTLKTLWV